MNHVYIHIPFCRKICSYCDFCKIFYDENHADDYLDALEKEIKDFYMGEEINTIYIGGGTPSVLNYRELERLFNIINSFKRDVNCEFTFECNPEDINDLYLSTRAEGFGEEVKRRIMVGSYLLSGENAKVYYNKALSIREDMRKEFKNSFKKYDLLIGPTTTTTAYNLDDPMDDPRKSFMDDVLVIPVNMAGLPGLNLPIGFDKNNMPIGMQIIGNSFEEAKIYKLASAIEKELNLNLTPGGEKNA